MQARNRQSPVQTFGPLPSALAADMTSGRRAWRVYWRPLGTTTWHPTGRLMDYRDGCEELARLGRTGGAAVLSHVSLPAPGSRPQPEERPLVQGDLFEADQGRPSP
jgi:hypothetical protein